MELMEYVWWLAASLLCLPASIMMANAAARLLPAKSGLLYRAAPCLLFWTTIRMPSWVGDENLLLMLPFFIAVFCLCYASPLGGRLAVGAALYALLMPVNMMLDSVPTSMSMLAEDAANMLAKCGLYAAVWALLWLLMRGRRPLQLPSRLWAICGLLLVSPLAALLSFSVWYGFGRDMRRQAVVYSAQLRLAYTILPFAFLSAAAVLAAMAVFARQQELEKAAKLADMREMYYNSLQTREAQLRTLRHDLRNHMAAVQSLLAQGECEQAQQYLQQLAASPAMHGATRLCENETANIVLCCKQEEAARCGLRADIAAAVPAALPIADTDLCALLGNALDNAIEAAQLAVDKTITVRARADKGLLMLCVQNSFAGAPPDDTAPASTKPNPAEHGLGIACMREIAARCGGTLQITTHENRFEMLACLPLAEKAQMK